MAEGAVALAALGLVASMLSIFNYMLKRSDKTIDANTKAGKQQASAIVELSTAVINLNNSITERDSRDTEFHAAVMKNFERVSRSLDSLDKKADRNLEAYSNIDKQVVAKQVVKKEVVKQQEVQGETSA